uniref:LppC lipoprotein n=1 Tax=Candidatus Kentrum sp. LPFa TaxID=2126335 RepID=A0A450VWY2_9GAMM|nr:MAG: hypothetical protein BECKLPF1236B_GA0070989_100719 [Candidatus Kentron sp. LPFa]
MRGEKPKAITINPSALSQTMDYKPIERFARAIPGSTKQRIEKNVIFSILQNQMLITFDFGGASLCHEILHFVQKSPIDYKCNPTPSISVKINSLIEQKITTIHRQRKPSKWRCASCSRKLLPLMMLAIAMLALITGCGTIPLPTTSESWGNEQTARDLFADGRLQEAAEQYLHLASQASPPRSYDYRLTAIKIHLDAQNTDTAKALLAKINPTRLTSGQQARRHLLKARIALAKQNPQSALTRLRKIHFRHCGHENVPLSASKPCDSELPKSFRIKFLRIRALAHSALGGEHILEAAKDRIALDMLLTKTAEIKANHQATWQLLISLPSPTPPSTDTRPSAPPTSRTGILQGWLTLADIVKQYLSNETDLYHETFSQAILSWQKQYQKHPAKRFLLKDLLATTKEKPPAHIALLLPLDGVFAGAGNAVRNGFLSAWFEGSSDSAQRPRITLRNTAGANIQSVYNDVVSAGAKFIVGPLDKPSVAFLEELPGLPIPTLTLNHGKETPAQSHRNASGTLTLSKAFTQTPTDPGKTAAEAPLYRFTLSPESEAQHIARRARYDGHARAAILTPQTPWGRRMEQTFISTWEQLGGAIVENRSFPTDLKEISRIVQQLLKTSDAMRHRQSIPKSSDTRERRSTDGNAIDCILMAAFPREARQLRPQIKFHHVGDTPMPIYATYHVFSGAINPLLDEDLDGIIFADMPWVLRRDPENQSTLRNLATSAWPESASKYSRFYALGIDAYRIIPYLKRLRSRNFPNFRGETGELSVDSQGNVNRQPVWAIIRRGKPVPDKNGAQYSQYQKGT